MRYKQLELILEPTSIEFLFEQDADNETLEEAMLLNWEKLGSLITEEDYWGCLFELPKEFIVNDEMYDYYSYKGIEYRQLVIKIRNRYFAYYYSSSAYDNECYEWTEVRPQEEVIKKTVWVPIKEEYCIPI